ncbi:RNA polymerase sigma-70 factor, ECF subfamily [Parapedobacter luteus]|uniref:RNA polymerase sigma-70 factor, ECF subfamily n=1 Tax=Parapedobacter luteus TaxID=623280 RepID=A0A1T5BH30_9SPHI|nr:sigma-70 family RNA polymerase sigma factor [Parapedobacter luteus]SKB46465.1 RNA polymerase sigma-70 factor, ECF subfamily [Parapedobacter luteus]
MSNDFYRTSILPYAAVIIKICRAYTASQEDFEDYYQEVCLQIWRSRANFRGQCSWSTWVYRVALNVCLTLLRRKKSKGHTYFSSDALPDVVTVENGAFADEQLNQLYVAVRHLSEVDRALILLYLEEKSYGEIAEVLGTNVNNIGVRINRIKERLKKIINERFN